MCPTIMGKVEQIVKEMETRKFPRIDGITIEISDNFQHIIGK